MSQVPYRVTFLLFFINTLCAALPGFISSASAQATFEKGNFYVEVAALKLRSEPKAWAKGIADLKYGDALKVEGTEGEWMKVSFNNTVGYVHKSALTVKKVVIGSALPTQGGTDSNDIVLAGKGLTDDVEKAFAGGHTDADFVAVSKLENTEPPSEKELTAFLRAGGLNGVE